ncbi:hypothetical protein SAMN04487906_1165 [Zhouia amylolytica]|uniref:Uncharacterized protein n=1 Tax=Zhouia amylolytica TaxID=376730 RepID=A0A1I6RMG0_9FLAO|nr:hypothetical protein [Zhouia amylolytica]SFS65790.1 hypothetical protein SAMN04487906_1165 [Zhouia amylolytica]
MQRRNKKVGKINNCLWYLLTLLMMFILVVGCIEKNNKNHSSTEVTYYYQITNHEDEVLNYRIRSYKFIHDSIFVNTTILDSLKIESEKYQRKYVKEGNNLYVIYGKGKNLRKELFLSTHNNDSCVVYINSFNHKIRNCLSILSKDSEGCCSFRIVSENLEIDGGISEIFLDSNYSLVRRTDITGLAVFKEEIRIDSLILEK